MSTQEEIEKDKAIKKRITEELASGFSSDMKKIREKQTVLLSKIIQKRA